MIPFIRFFNDSNFSIRSNGSLPKDLWVIIITYVARNNDLKSIVSASTTCKGFWDLCIEQALKSCLLFRIGYTLAHLKGNELTGKEIDLQPTKSLDTENFCVNDDSGRHFLISNRQLHVVDLTQQNAYYEIDFIFPSNIIKNDEIISCHPFRQGFIVITSKLVCLFDDRTQNTEYLTPFNDIKDKGTITSAGLYCQKLILQICISRLDEEDQIEIRMLDIDHRENGFVEITTSNTHINFIPMGFEPLFSSYVSEGAVFHKARLEHNTTLMQVKSELDLLAITTPSFVGSNKWLVYFYKHNIRVISLCDYKLWKHHRVRTIIIPNFFVQKDFLFISDSKGVIEVCYLPSKFDMTKWIKPILDPLLKNRTLVSLMINFIDNKTLELCLLVNQQTQLKLVKSNLKIDEISH